jgi:radical SAM protein with 4Fe4S-binding SPASM domain
MDAQLKRPPDHVAIRVNSNFHHSAREDLFDRNDERFVEYRRKWKEWPETFRVGDFPLFIDLEVTSICNLRCPFCSTTFHGGAVKKGHMPLDIVKRVVDEGAGQGLYGVKFNIRGEPLLHPQISEAVAYAKSKGLIDVYFNSNAMLLSGEMCRKLIDAGLDRISISADGCTKDEYERHRVGAHFETVVANVERLQAIKQSLKVKYPKVRVQTVLLPEVKNHFKEYQQFWSGIADEVAHLDYMEMKERKRGIDYPWACPQIWQRMAVWWDGTILPCNHDEEGLLALGNIRDTTIRQAWSCEKLREVRDAHRRGKSCAIPACDGCYFRDAEIRKLRQEER